MSVSVRHVFIAVFIIGMALCSRGIGLIAKNNDWMSIYAIAGYALGILALVLFLSVMFRNRFLFISGDREALVFLLGIIVVKFLVGMAYSFFNK